MGLLDDAIREHLDLKRRRGADPAEVARLEQEALGPVRREPAPAGAADEHHEEAPHAPEPPAPAGEHAHPLPAGEHLHAADATHVLAPEDRHEPPHGDPLRAPDAELGGAAAPEPPAPAPPAPAPEPREEPAAVVPPQPDPRHSDVVDQPTTEYRVEDHHDDEHEHPEPAAQQAQEPQAAAEDVLEETPDFLQETPEHDRLWFEQRPPRDFDFDG